MGDRMVDWDNALDRTLLRGVREEDRKVEPRRSKRTPHERGRAGRRVTLDFPDGGWKAAVWEVAERWGVRPCDVYVLAVARLLAAIEAGEVGGPVNGGPQFWERAGSGMDLPWEP
jgi:hypothetical protein